MSPSGTFGRALPDLQTAVPGPRSRELGRRLRAVESRNITRIDPHGPIFWTAATGANVRDADGNVFIDLTAGFGVAAGGHSSPAVAEAVARQVRRLAHAMGDVHPADVKVELLERLAALAPGDLSVTILSANGSDAVESALKTAALATGRPGLVAFRGGYHGLGYGALSVTADRRFREPFRRQLYAGVRFAAFPSRDAPDPADAAARSLQEVRQLVVGADPGEDPVGAVIVEPVQGRAGIVVPPDGFLPGLRALCDELGILLIADEIYTGLGRTGRWFACDHWNVVPDLLLIGKSLAGGLPLSAVVGRPRVMAAWPPSGGEAIHTSTFLGNPVTAAAALAQLRALEDGDLPGRADRLGTRLGARLRSWAESRPEVAGSRGLGLMRALELAGPEPAEAALRVVRRALDRGVIVLSEGPALAFTPPLVITERQLEHALDVLGASLSG